MTVNREPSWKAQDVRHVTHTRRQQNLSRVDDKSFRKVPAFCSFFFSSFRDIFTSADVISDGNNDINFLKVAIESCAYVKIFRPPLRRYSPVLDQ